MKKKLLSLLLLNYVYNDAIISLLLLSLRASLLAYYITADWDNKNKLAGRINLSWIYKLWFAS